MYSNQTSKVSFLYLAIANNGDVYITDSYNMAVVVLNSTWNFKFQISSLGSGLTQLINPSTILINNSLLYIADGGSSSNLPQRVQIFDLNGNYMHNLSYSGYKNLQFPSCMGFLDDGTTAVLSEFFGVTWLHFFSPNGTFLQYITINNGYSSSSMGVFSDNLIALYNSFGVQNVYNITYYQINSQVPSNISTNSTIASNHTSYHSSYHSNHTSNHSNHTSNHSNHTSNYSNHTSNHSSGNSDHSLPHGTSSISYSANLLIPIFIQFIIILAEFVVNHDY